jgi:hypothetical protein
VFQDGIAIESLAQWSPLMRIINPRQNWVCALKHRRKWLAFRLSAAHLLIRYGKPGRRRFFKVVRASVLNKP